ncbi:MAG: hypothetical protein JNL72_01100 [Flavipsychrobacter sp.]|nr:hypothetical protein [Flavipsychrobacter sp.]
MKVKYLLSLLLLWAAPANGQTDYSGMVNNFKQGARDNAAAISLIKAAIAAFDTGHVYEEKPLANGGWAITLKNGTQHLMTPQELEEAIRSADLYLKDGKDSSALKCAWKCYALMAKQRQLQVAGMGYADALQHLDGQADVETIYELLGLEKNIKKFRNGAYVENLCAIVAWRGKDVVYSCNGIMDRKGKQINMSVFYRGRFQVVDEWDADLNPGKM